jgi:phosphatidylserine/phosphatidylglycerophosphate/cardiolipin synthase-like enzyme/regulation of enolase protein 1 (concanavalin A-like superfamily)
MSLQRVLAAVASCALLVTAEASAEERLCDASRENCRVPLVDLIDHEDVGIDVGVWFIKDARIPAAIIRARSRGVPVRMIMDTRAYVNYPSTEQYMNDMAAAGVQMRRRTAGDICHWKLMIFSRQNVVEWSGANFSPIAFVPNTPYRDYEDEVIHFSEQLAPSFKKTFDDIWTNTTEYADHRNITRPLVRKYPTYAVDARLNFPPRDSYQDRLIPLIDNEPPDGLIDVDMYRLTLSRPVSAIIRAAARGVRVRMYLEPEEYTNVDRPGNKTQMDRLVAAAQTYPGTIEIRMRKHLGLNHQKTIWLHSQRIVVFGTSNWSDASDDNQLEANFFTDAKAPRDALGEAVFYELNKIFERKFYNEAPDGSIETVAWRTPSLPRPDLPSSTCNDPRANNNGGPAPCTYDPDDPEPPESDAPTVVLWASKTSSSDLHGNWQMVTDTTAAGGRALANPNFGQAKISPAFTAPPNYFEATFTARAGTPYHLWVRLRAENNSMGNDSVHLQFSDSVTATSAATMRIGTTSSAEVVLQDGSGDSSVSGWGWADNGWGEPGDPIYFQSTGTHTVRVQQREDGAIIDQIVLSPNLYRTAAPGSRDGDNTILAATEAGDPGGTLPSGWQTANIGSTSGGSASASGGVFTVTGGGADVWGTADAFRFVYQPLAADGAVVARVASVQNVNAWTKAGVMIRQTLTAGSVHASLFVTPANGLAFQSRTTTGGTSVSTAVPGAPPQWVRLVRAGQVVTASVSSNGTSWTDVGQQTLPLSGSVYAGLAVTSHSTSQLATATFDNVSVKASAPTCNDPAANNYGGPAPCTYDPVDTLPSDWQTGNIGAASGGSAGASGGVFTVTGGGADVWGTADAFRYVYQPLAADGVVVARVASVQNVNAWTKAGVMIRQSLTAGSVHASLFVSPSNGIAFQSRATTGGTSVSAAVTGAAPAWVRLVRAGQTVTASVSSDGTSWTDVGQRTISLSGSVYAGLAVSSHSTSQLATATFDNVSVKASAPTCNDPAANNYGGPAPCTYDPPDTLPSDWQTGNIGAASGGSASESGGVFTVTGGGADVWGTADAFRYVYQSLAADGVIVARVASVQNVNAWTKAGVMIRQTLTAGSVHASLFVSPSNGIAFQSRATTGGTSVSAAVTGAAPTWVRLVRAGQTVTASVSSDGTSWTDIGQRTIPFSGSVYVGLAVTSHSTTQLASATFDGVTITPQP